MLIAVLSFVLLQLFPFTQAYLRVFQLCEGSNGTLTCPNNYNVRVIYVQYGGPASTTCTGSNPADQNCKISTAAARLSTNNIAAMCQNKTSCFLQASSSIFGDPCVGKNKTLTINYYCLEKPRKGSNVLYVLGEGCNSPYAAGEENCVHCRCQMLINGIPVKLPNKYRGFNFAAVDFATLNILETKNFDTHGNYWKAGDMISWINSLTSGTLVMLCSKDEATVRMSSAAWATLDSLGLKNPHKTDRSSHALIGFKGISPVNVTAKSKTTTTGDLPAVVSLVIDINECKSHSINNCHVNADCTNTDGSYNCACKNGFSGDGISCVDIDECIDGPQGCNVNANCTNTLGSYECNCKNGFFGNGFSCDSGVTRIICGETAMTVYLNEYTMKSNRTSITLRNSSCTVKRFMPGNVLGLVTSYKDCGTIMKETSTHIEYTNEVLLQENPLPGKITRTNHKSIAVTCSIARHADTNVIQILAPVTTVNATESGYGSFKITLSMMTSSDFTTKVTSFPVTVSLDLRVHFEAQVNSPDTALILLLEECSASPTMDKNHPSKHYLIKSRCGVKDSTVKFHASGSPHKNWFSFKSFKFVGTTNSVFLHCKVFMCHKESDDSRCTSGCQHNNINRVRRSFFDDRKEYIKNIKRREIQTEYLPSSEYSLSIGPFIRGKQPNEKQAASKGFTTIHGMGVGLGAMGLVLIGIAVKYCASRKTDIVGMAKEKDMQVESNTNEAFELSLS